MISISQNVKNYNNIVSELKLNFIYAVPKYLNIVTISYGRLARDSHFYYTT